MSFMRKMRKKAKEEKQIQTYLQAQQQQLLKQNYVDIQNHSNDLNCLADYIDHMDRLANQEEIVKTFLLSRDAILAQLSDEDRAKVNAETKITRTFRFLNSHNEEVDCLTIEFPSA